MRGSRMMKRRRSAAIVTAVFALLFTAIGMLAFGPLLEEA